MTRHIRDHRRPVPRGAGLLFVHRHHGTARRRRGRRGQCPGAGQQPLTGLFTGWLHWLPGDACEAGVTTITDAQGDTNLGKAILHSEHCPSMTEAPHEGTMSLYFEDASTLTATYQVTCVNSLPEGPSILECTSAGGEVTGGTGRFEGATGTFGFPTALIWFSGAWGPLVGVDWIGTVDGSLTMAAPAPAESPAA